MARNRDSSQVQITIEPESGQYGKWTLTRLVNYDKGDSAPGWAMGDEPDIQGIVDMEKTPNLSRTSTITIATGTEDYKKMAYIANNGIKFIMNGTDKTDVDNPVTFNTENSVFEKDPAKPTKGAPSVDFTVLSQIYKEK